MSLVTVSVFLVFLPFCQAPQPQTIKYPFGAIEPGKNGGLTIHSGLGTSQQGVGTDLTFGPQSNPGISTSAGVHGKESYSIGSGIGWGHGLNWGSGAQAGKAKQSKSEDAAQSPSAKLESKTVGIGTGGQFGSSGLSLGSGVQGGGQTAGIGSSLNWNDGLNWQSGAGIAKKRKLEFKNGGESSDNAVQSKAAGIGTGGHVGISGLSFGSGVHGGGHAYGIGSHLNWSDGLGWQFGAGGEKIDEEGIVDENRNDGTEANESSDEMESIGNLEEFLANEPCVWFKKCTSDKNCFGGFCSSLVPLGKCDCGRCPSFRICETDEDCENFIGACDSVKRYCDCDAVFRKFGNGDYWKGRELVCNNRTCIPDRRESCFGLSCTTGACTCPEL